MKTCLGQLSLMYIGLNFWSEITTGKYEVSFIFTIWKTMPNYLFLWQYAISFFILMLNSFFYKFGFSAFSVQWYPSTFLVLTQLPCTRHVFKLCIFVFPSHLPACTFCCLYQPKPVVQVYNFSFPFIFRTSILA